MKSRLIAITLAIALLSACAGTSPSTPVINDAASSARETVAAPTITPTSLSDAPSPTPRPPATISPTAIPPTAAPSPTPTTISQTATDDALLDELDFFVGGVVADCAFSRGAEFEILTLVEHATHTALTGCLTNAQVRFTQPFDLRLRTPQRDLFTTTFRVYPRLAGATASGPCWLAFAEAEQLFARLCTDPATGQDFVRITVLFAHDAPRGRWQIALNQGSRRVAGEFELPEHPRYGVPSPSLNPFAYNTLNSLTTTTTPGSTLRLTGFGLRPGAELSAGFAEVDGPNTITTTVTTDDTGQFSTALTLPDRGTYTPTVGDNTSASSTDQRVLVSPNPTRTRYTPDLVTDERLLNWWAAPAFSAERDSSVLFNALAAEGAVSVDYLGELFAACPRTDLTAAAAPAAALTVNGSSPFELSFAGLAGQRPPAATFVVMDPLGRWFCAGGEPSLRIEQPVAGSYLVWLVGDAGVAHGNGMLLSFDE